MTRWVLGWGESAKVTNPNLLRQIAVAGLHEAIEASANGMPAAGSTTPPYT